MAATIERTEKTDMRALGMLAVPCFIIAIVAGIAAQRMAPLDGYVGTVVAAGLLAWGACVGVVALVARGRPWSMRTTARGAVLLLIPVPLAIAAALFFVNSQLDSSRATTHATRVLQKDIATGAHAGGARTIWVTPWDRQPGNKFEIVDVSRSMFDVLRKGDRVDIDVHPGTLGWQWVSDVRRAD